MADKFEKKELKKKSENIADWYNDVVLKAELADYGPVRGTMVIRPYGYSIWEKVQEILNGLMKESDVQNAYFPLFIPYEFLKREKKHVEGFSPELALVTIGGGETLKEPLVVRPTSETIMYEMYKKWIKSWRDLPLKINQWNNVIRWEKRTYLFLRTMEFLWQEGHTAHAEEGEAIELCVDVLEWYRYIYEDQMAIPVINGVKSESERFAGAKDTYTLELLMPDGKALQGATTHNLGQNFSKVFEVSFQDKEGKSQHVWQTSWAITTRSIGALVLVHGDDHGIVLPPKIAPYQVVIVPIYKKDQTITDLDIYIEQIAEDLKKKDIRVHIDKRDGISVGRKFNDWEVKGVPLRFEIGEVEREQREVTMTKRNTGEKLTFKREGIEVETANQLDAIQQEMLAKAREFVNKNTSDVDTYDKFKEVMSSSRGFIRAFWCEDPVCETKIKEETKASTRAKPLDFKEGILGKCIYCGKEAKNIWYFGQSY